MRLAWALAAPAPASPHPTPASISAHRTKVRANQATGGAALRRADSGGVASQVAAALPILVNDASRKLREEYPSSLQQWDAEALDIAREAPGDEPRCALEQVFARLAGVYLMVYLLAGRSSPTPPASVVVEAVLPTTTAPSTAVVDSERKGGSLVVGAVPRFAAAVQGLGSLEMVSEPRREPKMRLIGLWFRRWRSHPRSAGCCRRSLPACSARPPGRGGRGATATGHSSAPEWRGLGSLADEEDRVLHGSSAPGLLRQVRFRGIFTVCHTTRRALPRLTPLFPFPSISCLQSPPPLRSPVRPLLRRPSSPQSRQTITPSPIPCLLSAVPPEAPRGLVASTGAP